MSTSPTRRFNRVSSRIKGKYISGESLGNVEVTASFDDAEILSPIDAAVAVNDEEGEDKIHPPAISSPYGLRRIFSNPPQRSDPIQTSLLHSADELHPCQTEVHTLSPDKSKPYGLRRIFSNPSDKQDVAIRVVPLTKTNSYHHPSSRGPKSPYRESSKKEPGSPLSLVRRVSRLRTPEKTVKHPDDITVDESVEVSMISSSSSGSSRQQQQASKSKKKYLLLFILLGIAAGGYMGYHALSNKDSSSNSNDKQINSLNFNSYKDSSEYPPFVPDYTLSDDEHTQYSDGFVLDSIFGVQDYDVTTTSSTAQESPLLIYSLSDPSYSPTVEPTDHPVADPTDHPVPPPTWPPSPRPTYPPRPPSPRPTPRPTSPSPRPTRRPTYRPTRRPTPPVRQTPPPTEDTTLTFYVMADAPYSDYERDVVMPDVVDNLPSDAEFLVHLGDLEYYKEDNCEEWAYVAAKRALRRSSVPVFVVPGDNDLNDCDDHDEAEYFWTNHFGYFDEHWNHTYSITRWGKLDESYAFITNRILFFGLNVVGGTPYSDYEKTERHKEHLHMMKSIMNNERWEYDVVVLLAHAEPKDHHDDLFKGDDGLANFVADMKKPFLHLHGDYHWWYEEDGWLGVENYLRISFDSMMRGDDEVTPPVRIKIDSSKRYGAIKIDRGKSGWEVECCGGSGWPREPVDDCSYGDDYYYDSEDY